jgi:gamma-glutamylcyclotransferase (GGCT)/AIG2-like uncharacterized protein YtfP
MSRIGEVFKCPEHLHRAIISGLGQIVQLRAYLSYKDSCAMPLLFSYGTLQHDNVQMAIFGRLLQGQPDALPEFEPSSVPIEDPQVLATSGMTHYANVTFNGRKGSHVSGTVFEITHAEFAAADRYEQPAGYKRMVAPLASGKQAWVYVAPAP